MFLKNIGVSKWLMLSALASLLSACGDGESDARKLSLLEGRKVEPAPLTAEQERLRKMQMVQIYEVNSDGTLTPVEKGSYTAGDLRSSLYASCSFDKVALTGIDTTDVETLAMANWVEEAALRVCTAERLAEVADASVIPVTYRNLGKRVCTGAVCKFDTPTTFQVPPQETSVKATLYDESRAEFYSAFALGTLLIERGVRRDPKLDTSPLVPLTTSSFTGAASAGLTDAERAILGERLATVMAMAFRGYERTALLAAEKVVEVADSQKGSTSEGNEALRRVWSADYFSRVAAAHRLVGGSGPLTLQGNAVSAFCANTELSWKAKKALQAMRESGVAPSTIASSLATSALIDGRDCLGSVRERLAIVRNDDSLWGVKSVKDITGASLEDFEHAREYLKQEQRAFGVTDSEGALPTSVKCDGQDKSWTFYGGTKAAPNRPDQWFTAVARSGGYQSVWPWALLADWRFASAYMSPVSKWEDDQKTGLPSLADFYIAASQRIPSYFSARDWYVNDQSRILDQSRVLFAEQNMRPLLGVTDTVNRLLLGYFDVYDAPYPPHMGHFQFGTSVKLNQSKVVLGYSSAACLEKYGESIIAECPVVELPLDPDSSKGHLMYLVPQSTEPVYVLTLNAQGRWVIIASAPPTSSEDPVYYSAPVVPYLDQMVGNILRPSPDQCTVPAVSCGRASYNARLPLENELSDDKDGIESSWRYYLNLARSAADEADLMANEFLDASLAVDQQGLAQEQDQMGRQASVERELETVQEICGTAVDAGLLLKQLGDNGKLESMRTGTACTGDSACADGAQCVAGQCLKSPISLIESSSAGDVGARIRECLGSDTTYPFISAGTFPMCYWVSALDSDPTQKFVCSGDSPAYRCPLFVNGMDTDCDSMQAPSSVGSTTTKVFVGLGLGLVSLAGYENKLRTMKYGSMTPLLDASYSTGGLERCGLVIGDIGRNQSNLECYTELNKALHDDYSSDCPSFDPDELVVQVPGTTHEYAPAAPEKMNEVKQRIVNSLACNQIKLRAKLAARVFANVPKKVAESLTGDQAVTGVFPAVGGTYGEKLTLARSSLVNYSKYSDLISGEFDAMLGDFDKIFNGIQILGLDGELKDLTEQQLALAKEQAHVRIKILELQRDAAIAKASLGILSKIGQMVANPDPKQIASGILDVANSGVEGYMGAKQLDQQIRVEQLQQQIIELDEKKGDIQWLQKQLDFANQMIDARLGIRKRYENIKGYAKELLTAYESFDASLVSIENERNRALRALSRAVYESNAVPERAKIVNQVLSNTAYMRHHRYEIARQNAVKMAFYAKRAIEQRLGMTLASMTQRGALMGQPPSQWENDICVSTGLNYKKIQDRFDNQAFKGTYIGEYVDKLEQLVESYRMDNGFSDGTDQMILSLKEDLFETRTECEVPTKNLLKWSTNPGQDPTMEGAAWERVPADASVAVGAALGNVGDYARTKTVSITGATGAVRQTVDLTPGDYVLSWFGGQGFSVDLRDSNNVPVESTWGQVPFSESPLSRRSSSNYTITVGGKYTVNASGASSGTTTYGGFMLEPLTVENRSCPVEDINCDSDPVSARESLPSRYVATDATNTVRTRTCADKDGSSFRHQFWTRRCIPMCDSGLGTGCIGADRPMKCYWETSFYLSQRELEAGTLAPNVGFAIGNFNYRIEDIGVNFVGTGLRACSVESGNSCFSAGYIPYSLIQTGPFTVTNHEGVEYRAPLFDGKIEHAKGLALERYLTNPLSRADQDLLGTYLRKEFQGRPLDGGYMLRVWDDAGVDFNKIEDVQLYLKYRYWTRLN